MDLSKLPGWYVDAMEQNLGALVVQQRDANYSVEDLAELVLNPASAQGVMSPEEHLQTLAVCMAILIRRLVRVDSP